MADPKVELTLPVMQDMELAATKTAEVVANRMGLDEMKTAEINMALIEACINAFEHSKTKDNVFITYIFEGDTLVIKVGDKGKGFDTFGPIGPYIVTIDELPDFQNLNMFLEVDGKRMQTGNTNQMIFNISQLVSYMSSLMTLYPGDICCTGTPPGVGENMKPPKFLLGGEKVKLGVDKLGEQNHKVIT